MTTNEIHSPAGLWIRVLAFILDAIVIGVPLAILGILAFGTTENYLANSISLLYYLIVPVIWYGYTVGKKIVGIRIVKTNGENVGIGTMFMRSIVGNIVNIITLGITLIVSLVLIIIRSDKRTIQDLIAGTYVTYKKPVID